MQIPFSKYSGCGNDFILIDNRQNIFPTVDKCFIRKLCQRRIGIGADGIILLEISKIADFGMRIFNADGSEAEMCGNGIRSLGRYIRDLGNPEEEFTIEVLGRIFPLKLEGSLISVTMGPPSRVDWSLQIPLKKEQLTVDFLDTGVPHVVIFAPNIKDIDLAYLGPAIRYHSQFSPRGTNVNLASIGDRGELSIRTYERGVEDETLACGTGAAAVALAAAKRYSLNSPIIVQTHSGEKLEFHLKHNRDRVEEMTMRGPANFVYRGEFRLPDHKI